MTNYNTENRINYNTRKEYGLMTNYNTENRIDVLESMEIQHERLADALGYTQFSNAILLAENLSPLARLLYAIIKRYADIGQAIPGRETLAQHLGGVSTKTVDRYLNELVEIGLIEKVRRGKRLTNKYILKELTDELIHRLNPDIKKYRELQERENHDQSEHVDPEQSEWTSVSTHQSEWTSVSTHEWTSVSTHPSSEWTSVSTNKERASNKKKRDEESMHAGGPARWQSHHKYQEKYQALVDKYGQEALAKAWTYYLQGVNEGKWAPKRLIPFFYHIVETDILPLVERELIPPGYNMPSLEDLKRQEQVEEEMEQERRRRQQQQQAREFDGLPKTIRQQMEREARGEIYESQEDPVAKAKIMEELMRMRQRFAEKRASGQ